MRNLLAELLAAGKMTSDIFVVGRPLVSFLGSLDAGMMLSQLLYWTTRSTMEDGIIAKTDKEFCEELCIKTYSLRNARKLLEEKGFVETKVSRFNKFPTVHYKVNLEKLFAAFKKWASEQASRSCENAKTEGVKKGSRSCENAKTVLANSEELFLRNQKNIHAEITAENTAEKGIGSHSTLSNNAAAPEITSGDDDPLYLAVISKCDQRQDAHNRLLAIRFLSEKQISLKRFCSFVEWFSRDVWIDKPPLLGQIKKYWPEFEAYENKIADQERRRVAAEEKQAQRERETREQIRAELPIARAAAEEWIRNQRQGELAQDLQRQQEILDDRKASLRNIHAPQSVIDGLRLDMTLDEWCSLSKPLTRAFMEKTYNVPPLSAVAQ